MTRIFTRRSALQAILAGISVFGANLIARNSHAAQQADEVLQPSWSYEGVTGPEHWSELSPDYASCQFGAAQSPIDLIDAVKTAGTEILALDYRPATARVDRDDFNIRVELDPGCQITLFQRVYALDSFRFCRPSEHLLSGRALEMELQFLHRSENDAIAMTAFFLRQGAANEALEVILANLPEAQGDPAEAPVFPLNPIDLVPKFKEDAARRSFYFYPGSMTAPPCQEGVRWVVFKMPAEASPQQIRKLASLFPKNARPPSAINARSLLEYEGTSASVAL